MLKNILGFEELVIFVCSNHVLSAVEYKLGLNLLALPKSHKIQCLETVNFAHSEGCIHNN